MMTWSNSGPMRIPAIDWCAAFLLVLLAAALFSGCSRFVSSAASNMALDISAAVADNNDLRTVQDGAPSQMLMIDGLLRRDPHNETLLELAAELYSAYTAGFVTDNLRARTLTDTALGYALRAVCLRRADACDLPDASFARFNEVLSGMRVPDVPALYSLGFSWAVWIQSRSQDLDAVAQISRVEAVMQRVIELDETYRMGQAHVYLGILAALLPPVLGGRPEEGRRHFERAISLSDGRNLMAKVAYAQYYARMAFDRPLHDRLLMEVLAADPELPGYTLQNILAQKRAQELLNSADDFF